MDLHLAASGRRRTHALLLLVLMLATLILPATVHAAPLVRCRSDPVVLLSNGTLIDLSADIDALLFDVTRVNYILHVPAGLYAIAVIRTPNWPATIEQFVIYSDNAPGRYTSATTVYTRYRNVSVTANMLVGLATTSASGYDRQTLRLNLSLP